MEKCLRRSLSTILKAIFKALPILARATVGMRRKWNKLRVNLVEIQSKIKSALIPSLFHFVMWLPTKTLAIPLKLVYIDDAYFQLYVLTGWRRWAAYAFHADVALHTLYVTFTFFRGDLKLTVAGMLTMDALIYTLSFSSVWIVFGVCIVFDMDCRRITALYNAWSLVLHQFSGTDFNTKCARSRRAVCKWIFWKMSSKILGWSASVPALQSARAGSCAYGWRAVRRDGFHASTRMPL